MSEHTMCLSHKPAHGTAVETWCGRIAGIGDTLGPYATDATVCPTCEDYRQQARRGQYLAARAVYFRDRRRKGFINAEIARAINREAEGGDA